MKFLFYPVAPLVCAIITTYADTSPAGKDAVPEPWVFVPQTLSPINPHTGRAGDYPEALKQAKATGKDIVIFQRGRDWCVEGERMYHNVWNTEAMLKELGDGFIMVTIDDPENPDAPPVPQTSDPKLAVARPYQLFAADRLRDYVQRIHTPQSEVLAVTAKSGTLYKKQPDGSFLIDIGKKGIPNTDTITVNLKAKPGDSVIRLDFLPHPALHTGGPGTMHGCISLTHVEAKENDAPLKVRACYSDTDIGSYMELLDETKKPQWGMGGGNRQKTLVLTLDKPVTRETEISVVLLCQDTDKVRLLPGCISAVSVTNARVDADVCSIYDNEVLRLKNKDAWNINFMFCPRVALHDANGIIVGESYNFKGEVSSQSLADEIKMMRTQRVRRDEKWAEAQKAQGPERAMLLLQGFQCLPFAERWKHKDPNGLTQSSYGFLSSEIRRVDPEDKSGVTRWFSFLTSHTRPLYTWEKLPPDKDWHNVLEGTRGTRKKPTDGDFVAALACIDGELNDPRNVLLQPSQIQILANAKVELYGKWKKLKEQWEWRKRVIAYDPESYWGLIHTGWLGYDEKYQSDEPFLTYGWGASIPELGLNHVKAGDHTWCLRDTAYRINHPGKYRLTLRDHPWSPGKDSITIRRIALVKADNPEEILTEVIPPAGQNQVGPYGPRVTAELDCSKWERTAKYVMQIEYTAVEGHCNSTGIFELKPVFVDE